MQKKISCHRHFNTKTFQNEAILKTFIGEKHRMLVWSVTPRMDGQCYAFCKNFKRLLSQHLVKFSVSSQNLVMKSQNKSDTHVLRDETTLYLNQKGIIVAGVTSTSE